MTGLRLAAALGSVTAVGALAATPASAEVILFGEDFQSYTYSRTFAYDPVTDRNSYNPEPLNSEGEPDNRLTDQSSSWEVTPGAPSPWQNGTLFQAPRLVGSASTGNTTPFIHTPGTIDSHVGLGGGQDYELSVHGLDVRHEVNYAPLASNSTLIVDYKYFLGSQASDWRYADVYLLDGALGFSTINGAPQDNYYRFIDAQGNATVSSVNSNRGNQWVSVRTVYDLEANDGAGSASLFTRLHNADGTYADADWVAVADMQNLNVNLVGEWTDLTHIYLAMNSNTGASQQLDDISVTAVPEPVSLALLGAGGMLGLLRRRRA